MYFYLKNASKMTQAMGQAEKMRILGSFFGLSRARIDRKFLLKGPDLFLGDLGECRAFGMKPANKFVESLDSSFLPTGISVSVVDLGIEDATDGFLIEGFAAIVGQDVVNLDALTLTFFPGCCAGLYEWSPVESLSAYG